jgi:hypothetical protein
MIGKECGFSCAIAERRGEGFEVRRTRNKALFGLSFACDVRRSALIRRAERKTRQTAMVSSRPPEAKATESRDPPFSASDHHRIIPSSIAQVGTMCGRTQLRSTSTCGQ